MKIGSMQATARLLALGTLGGIVAACGSSNEYAAKEEQTTVQTGPLRDRNNEGGSIFGDEGFTLSSLSDGSFFGGTDENRDGALPVNRFLWQASLDTLSFLPLSSTDPFTGVIATDWGAAPGNPDERFKVTAYMVNPTLAASSLRVAVYREVMGEGGAWVPATVSPETPRKLEDAILTRARQIRIASVSEDSTG